MPIEFACDACSRLLRVPDGSGGGSCTCPVCGKQLVVPEPGRAQAELLDQRAARPSPSANSSRIRVACPKCQHTLVCDRKLLGTKGQCRKCQAVFVISLEPTAAAVATTELVFNCPKCDQLFEGAPEMEGRKGKCHVCGEVFAIELKSSAAADGQVAATEVPSTGSGGKTKPAERPSRPTKSAPTPQRPSSRHSAKPQPGASNHRGEANGGTAGRVPDSTTTGRRNVSAALQSKQRDVKPAKLVESRAPIQLKCLDCQGLMEVPGDAAGQLTVCPFCSRQLQIPHVPQPSKSESGPSGSRSGPTQRSHTNPPKSSKQDATKRPSPAAGQGFDLFGGLEVSQQPSAGADAPSSTDPFSAPPTSHATGNVWDDLGDMSAAAEGGLDPLGPVDDSNPYAPAAGSDAWSSPAAAQRGGLSFSNVFGLAFERGFPMVILASLVYFGIAMLNSGITYGSLFLLGLVLGAAQLSPDVVQYVVLVAMVVLALVSLCITTAAVCMMCNAALHCMRRRQPDYGELVSTGGAWGSMLVFLFLMTLLGALFGIGPGMLADLAQSPALSLLGLLAGLGFTFVLFLAFSLAPFAILDGENPLQAMSTSVRIFTGQFFTVAAVGVCTLVAFTGVTIATCGLAGILLAALPCFVLAATYQLATK